MLELPGGGWGFNPQFISTDAHFFELKSVLNFSPCTKFRSSDGWAKNQLGERRLGELFFGRQTIGRQARTVRIQQIGRLGDIVQTVGRNA